MVRFSLLFKLVEHDWFRRKKSLPTIKAGWIWSEWQVFSPCFLFFFDVTLGPLDSRIGTESRSNRREIKTPNYDRRERVGRNTLIHELFHPEICHLLTDISKNSCPGGVSSTVSSIQWLDGWLSHHRQFSDFTVVLPDSSITRFMHTSSMHYKQAPRIQIAHTK